MFSFDPKHYAATYAEHGFVHIPHGLSEEFYNILAKQVEDHLHGELLKNFALGDKQQALYQFPNEHFHRELLEGIAGVCGFDPAKLVLSERHIKAYDVHADPSPLAHKDRFASEVSVGFSVRVPEGSTLVLYPYDELEINSFNSSAELRASLRPDTLPEKTLKEAARVEIKDAARDVMMFRGNAIWHLRARPAGTVMVYFKLNTFNCDPIGEDPSAVAFRRRSQELAACSDDDLEALIPLLGRRVDAIQCRYNHQWQEVFGVVLWGEKHLTIDDSEFRALKAIDGQRPLGEIIDVMGTTSSRSERLHKLRFLAVHGAIDLVPATTHVSSPCNRSECELALSHS
jgi:hypothetical protein